MPNIPPENGKPVSFGTVNLAQIIRQLWGPQYYRPDTGYEFSNGRRFDASDQGTSGVYRPR